MVEAEEAEDEADAVPAATALEACVESDEVEPVLYWLHTVASLYADGSVVKYPRVTPSKYDHPFPRSPVMEEVSTLKFQYWGKAPVNDPCFSFRQINSQSIHRLD